jgi:thiosulfate/3-mercaptopyruvate sulfurtransferase
MQIVSIEWLTEHLTDEDLILLDASLPSTAEGKYSEHDLKTIPGARFFDLKESFSDKRSPFPNTLPSEEQFEIESRKLGINTTSKIVVFDNLGIYSSPRVWWMFKVMGHDNVFVLNSGLPEWIKKGLPTASREAKRFEPGDFKASFQKPFLISYQEVLDNINIQSFTIIDARSEGRFNGTEKEPRKNLKSGHISDSINIPYTDVLDNGKFKNEQELREIFEKKCTDEKELVFSCGSGLTACIVMLASDLAFKKSLKIYDGSWTEWAEIQNLKENLL